MQVLNQSMCFSKADLTSLRHVRAKYKDKLLNVSGFRHIIMQVWTQVNLKYRKASYVKDDCS